MLLIPVDSRDPVRGRQIGIALSRVIKDGPQTPHGPIGNVRTVFLRKLVVTFDDKRRLPAEPGKWMVEPILLDPMAVALLLAAGAHTTRAGSR
jgi:hypothetical protein